MTSEIDHYRLLNRLDLAPSFTSLGLDPAVFRAGGDAGTVGFNAAMSGPGDIVWLFRGSDYLGFDLRQEKVAIGPKPIAADWVGGALPADFKVGVDSAVWAGPGIPKLAFLFRGGDFVRLERSDGGTDPGGWGITMGPYPTGKEWLRIPSTDGRPHYGPVLEPCAKLYGLREAANRVHFFTRDGRYARHNFNNGEYDIAPTTTMSQFALPASFNGRVDLAFYGVGAEAEHIYFFCRHEFAEYDLRRSAVVRAGAIEQRFPTLAPFLIRPQMYLVEDYSLDTYVGPLALGRLVSTLQVPPRSKRSSVVVTSITSAATLGLGQNVLERPSAVVVNDFYERIAGKAPGDAHLSRVLGADETAGLWAGEVDALTGTEPVDRDVDALLAAAFAALADQARESSHLVSQQVVDLGATATSQGEVINRETFELDNPIDTTIQVEFVELLQTYTTLMLLRNVRIAYTNGRDRPTISALREIDAVLAEVLVDTETAPAIVAYLKTQLARIQDSSGDMRSIIAAGLDLAVDASVKSVFVFDDIQPPQTMEMVGIVKAARTWRQPTYQTRAIDIRPDRPVPDISAEIRPIATEPRGEVRRLIEEMPG